MLRLCSYAMVVVAACLMGGRGTSAGQGDSRFDPEDATRTVPELIARHNYPVEVHTVTTSDGYILEMHRIPHGRDRNADTSPGKPAVLVMHGLISSSADFVIAGTETSLAYILAESGFDVWLGNARGNYYSRRHTSYNPESSISYWTFSFEEIGTEDIATKIDYILGVTGKSALHYIGHSQGTTAMFALCSLKPEYNAKIRSAHLFAPIAFLDHLDARILGIMASFSTLLLTLGALFGGMSEMFARGTALTMSESEDGKQLECLPNGLLTQMCNMVIPAFDTYDEDFLEVASAHTPAGSSLKQFAHYGQMMDNGFRRWRYSTPIQNIVHYGRLSPPEYDLNRITTHCDLWFSDGDNLTPEQDVLNTHARLPSSAIHRVRDANFTHFDFAWGTRAKELVYNDVMASIWQHESSRPHNP